MIDWEEFKKTPLDQTPPKHILGRCESICGAVAWPGKRPGFAVVGGTSGVRRFGGREIYLLDEYESMDTRELVRKCGVLDFMYWPKMWIGDYRNDAADRFINKMNEEFGRRDRQFYLTFTAMLEMERLYQYILPEIKQLRNKDCRQLFLRDSKILNYLSAIQPDEIPELELGDYPAIEAIAFAALEMLQRDDDRPHDPRDEGVKDLLSL